MQIYQTNFPAISEGHSVTFLVDHLSNLFTTIVKCSLFTLINLRIFFNLIAKTSSRKGQRQSMWPSDLMPLQNACLPDDLHFWYQADIKLNCFTCKYIWKVYYRCSSPDRIRERISVSHPTPPSGRLPLNFLGRYSKIVDSYCCCHQWSQPTPFPESFLSTTSRGRFSGFHELNFQ